MEEGKGQCEYCERVVSWITGDTQDDREKVKTKGLKPEHPVKVCNIHHAKLVKKFGVANVMSRRVAAIREFLATDTEE